MNSPNAMLWSLLRIHIHFLLPGVEMGTEIVNYFYMCLSTKAGFSSSRRRESEQSTGETDEQAGLLREMLGRPGSVTKNTYVALRDNGKLLQDQRQGRRVSRDLVKTRRPGKRKERYYAEEGRGTRR